MDKKLNIHSAFSAEEQSAFTELASLQHAEFLKRYELTRRLNDQFKPAISELVSEEGFAIEGNLFSPGSFGQATGEFAQRVKTGTAVVDKIVPGIRLSPAGPVEMDFLYTSTDLAEGVFGIPGNVDRINRTTIIRSRVDSSWSGAQQSVSGAKMWHSVKFTPNNWVEVFYRFRPEIHLEAKGIDLANGFDASLNLLVFHKINFYDPATGDYAGSIEPDYSYQFEIKSIAKLLSPGERSISGFLTLPSRISQGTNAYLIGGRKYLSELTCILIVETTKPGSHDFNINADARISLV